MLGNSTSVEASSSAVVQEQPREPSSYQIIHRQPRGFTAAEASQWKEKTVRCCGHEEEIAWSKCYGDDNCERAAVVSCYTSGVGIVGLNGLWAGLGGPAFLGAMAGPMIALASTATTHISCYVYHTYFSPTTKPFADHYVVPVYDDIVAPAPSGHVIEMETAHYDMIPEEGEPVTVRVEEVTAVVTEPKPDPIYENFPPVAAPSQVIVEAVVETEEAPPLPPRIES